MQDIFPLFLRPYVPIIQGVVTAIAIFVGGWLASKIAANLILRGLKRAKVDGALSRFTSSLGRYTILAATVITALGAVGVQTTSLVAIFASAGLAVGLALQGSLANFASGVLILFFRPFALGDEILVAGQAGVVEDIGIFTTALVTARNETVIIPNGKITSDTIVNYTTKGKHRGSIDITVAYGQNVQHILDHLLQAASRTELVLKDPGPAVSIANLADSGMVFNVGAWSTSSDYLSMLHHLRRSVQEELIAAKIDSPMHSIVVKQA